MNNNSSIGTFVHPLVKSHIGCYKRHVLSSLNTKLWFNNMTNGHHFYAINLPSSNSSKSDIIQSQSQPISKNMPCNLITECNIKNMYSPSTLSQCFRRTLSDLHVINVAHAAGLNSMDASNSEEKTTMERLLEGKRIVSKHHVTDAEIKQFIAAQTGLDRIKLLFTGIDTA